MNAIAFLFICLSMMLPSDHVACEQTIDSKAVLIINGQKLTAPFAVTINEKRVAVNGFEVTSLDRLIADRVIISFPKPPVETLEYIHWLVSEVTVLANSMIAVGDNGEDVWLSMKTFLEFHTKEVKNASLVVDGKSFNLRHSSFPEGLDILVLIPEKKYESETNHEHDLRFVFNRLCSNLRAGKKVVIESGVIRSSDRVSRSVIPEKK